MKSKLPYAMKGSEEAWILAAYPFFSSKNWFDAPQSQAVGVILKNSGGQLDPTLVVMRVEEIYAARGM
jgi:hypothetical protein